MQEGPGGGDSVVWGVGPFSLPVVGDDGQDAAAGGLHQEFRFAAPSTARYDGRDG